MATLPVPSESIEMYLKSICELEAIGSPVAISQLAQRQGVSPPSTIEMVKRLAAQDLVTHTPYKGVSLTEKGRRRAHNILRRHRLWERFLTDTLGLPWEQVHDHACRLEHATAPDVTEALDAFLGHPATCPHGNPIPTPDGHLPAVQTVPLGELAIGQRARLAHIVFEEAILLGYLARQNLFPGVVLTLEDVAPYQGPFIVRRDDCTETQAIGREIAARLFVEVLSE